MAGEAGLTDPAEEFEAVWAVVRRLEAQIRRLEASIAQLQPRLDKVQGLTAGPPSAQPRISPPHDTPATGSPAAGDAATASTVDTVDPADGPAEDGRPYRLVFDGGSLGNPGRGYGSFQIIGPRGEVLLHERLDFAERGDAVTNNQAEYLTLIHALDRFSRTIGERARATAVEIRGDSQLVINQLNGRWKVRNEELRPLFEQARSLLARFGHADLRWHARSNSVDLLGH